ncbi:MAG: diguanylate cyclase/phosphodiesterase (GGDEF & EAL domains) with PAS/PAC sensor(s) [Candidatus Carbobacillus altaicus]|uniref:Diguanylate cyclase/phosphodiesterase (GGDEF & EAL domains) with PAS/PAC sensor(S) n=1 Tax=Candidatus Carbonibacillus altaicus TaxID=2163959 RepID=A0A2R6Y0H2_9BACL|nr:MAG: diguanylate cyclase/phosphodiesterase (GGDEF & EAL domains) with PAS/PAC sensor(s) [Candidatus Carbobacillus altaicus]
MAYEPNNNIVKAIDANYTSSFLQGLYQKGANLLLFYDIVGFTALEERIGREKTQAIVKVLDDGMIHLLQQEGELLFANRSFGDDYLVFLRLEPSLPDQLVLKGFQKGIQLKTWLVRHIVQHFPELQGQIDFHMSAVPLTAQAEEPFERIFYRALKLAFKQAKQKAEPTDWVERELLYRILSERLIMSVYQPIVSLMDGQIIGYEALSRGPENTRLTMPLALFHRAEREGLTFALEKIAREAALKEASFLAPRQKLFLNVSPAVIEDDTFAPGHTFSMLQTYGFIPEQIVFEVTEQQSIADFQKFTQLLQHYRKQQYKVAVDDAGAGYASFQSILALKPDYIKIDRSLIQGIDQDPAKQSLLESFVYFAHKVNSKLIAEGVETLGELVQLIRLGVYAAQGFFLGGPKKKPDQHVANDVLEHIARHRRLLALKHTNQEIIEILAAPVKTFPARLTTSLVRQYFAETKDDGVVILEDGRIAGLVMREKLLQVLATQYGHSLYSRRAIHLVADLEPLVIQSGTPIDIVARLAMARPAEKAYDLILVASDDRLIGAVSIEALLNYMANIKMEAVRLANPLTGLPGNHAIDMRIRELIGEREPFALLYADLDHFKAYNDTFGYQRGDQIIQFLGHVLQSSAIDCAGNDVFIGHIGGDDFILLTPVDTAETLARKIVELFQEGIGFYYQGENIAPSDTGHADTGIQPDTPSSTASLAYSTATPVSVSVAVLICNYTRHLSTETIAEQAALIKKRVKAIPGNAYLVYQC